MRNRIVSACLIAVFFAMPQISIAEDNLLGQITFLSGTVQVKRVKETQWMDSTLNMSVYMGDTIQTKENAQATITFTDESVLKISPNSRVALDTIISPIEKRSSVLLFFGRIWNKVSQKALQKRVVEVQTPTAICGVRGTEFETAAYEDGTMIVYVNSGRVEVDNEKNQSALSANEGARVSFDSKTIKTQSGMKPDWEKNEKDGRQNLFTDGEKYGGYVKNDINQRRDHLKGLVDRASELAKKKGGYLAAAQQANNQGDEKTYALNMQKVDEINKELRALNIQIAFYGRRLECQFGLFNHYGDLAKDPVLSTMFRGKDFILKELDNIEMIQAEFDIMIEEGMKISMEDMEDLMDEMREKMDIFKEKRGKRDPFKDL